MGAATDLQKSSVRWEKRLKRERTQALKATATVGLGELYALGTVFVLTRLFMLFGVSTFLSDTAHYLDLAQNIDAGRMPYREFVFEYPPLAILPIYLPELLQRLVGIDTLEGYRIATWGLYAVIDLAIFALALRKLRSGAVSALGLWAYIFGGVLLAELIYDRYDIAMGGAVFAAVLWHNEGKRIRSGFAVAVGGLLKLIPITLAPLFMLESWRTAAGRARLAWLAAMAGLTGVGALASYAIFGESLFAFLDFHKKRGIQVESLWSSLQWLGAESGLTGPLPKMELNYGAMHLAHASATLDILAATAPLMALLAIFSAAVFSTRRPALGRVVLLALLAMIAFGKVLSPQYLVWPLCVLPLAGLDRRKARDWAFATVVLAITALTAFEFHHYFDILNLDDSVWLAVTVRNVAIAGLAAALAWDCFVSERWRPVAASIVRRSSHP